ncbi:MAG: GerMN domain-containing protein [Actinomycetota bacterium]
MRRVVLLGFALALVAGCARDAEVRLIPQDDLPADLYAVDEPRSVEERTVRTLVFFARTDPEGAPLDPERLGGVWREASTTRSTADFAVRRLLEGPTSPESRRLRTAISGGTELLGVSVRRGVADVNLTAQFEAAAGELVQLLRVAQVVWTLTELPEVDAVRFRIHGARQPVIDQLGVAHETVGRARYLRFAPQEGDVPDVVPVPVGSPTPTPTP